MAAKRSRRGFFIPLVLVIGLAVAAADVFPIRQIISQGRELEESRDRLEAIQEENRKLEGQIQDLHTPAEIERIARADFGYVRPGEISYVVIKPEETHPSEQPPPEAEPAPDPESGGFFQALWDYLTGRDVSDE